MDRRRSRFVTHIDTEIICVESYKTYSTGVPKVTILFRGPEETLVGTNARDKVLNVYPGLYSIDYKISSKGNITILSAEPINKTTMEDNDIKNALLKFNYIVSGETEKECPITIISRRDIVGEDAELVRFSFGYLEEPCVAIFYTDGTFFTPYDWQNPTWIEKDWTIENERWVDSRCMEAIVFMGMPRVLF